MNRYIDHTNLEPFATTGSIGKLCREAIEHKFRAVCVNPFWVHQAYRRLKDSNIKVVAVIGFPFGANCTETKVFETKLAIEHGADELDVVWNTGMIKNMNYIKVVTELIKIVEAAEDKVVKVIVETCYLSGFGIRDAYKLVRESGAAFIKTSTGFGITKAMCSKLDVIKVWKELERTYNQTEGQLKIKAAGGIRDYATARCFLDAGADVIGTSHGVTIMKGEPGVHSAFARVYGKREESYSIPPEK